MPQGDLAVLLAGETEQAPILVATNSPKQPVTVTSDSYRLPLVSGTKPEVCNVKPGEEARCCNSLYHLWSQMERGHRQGKVS